MNIILASGSPRRKEILENTNLKFSVITSDIDERIFENEEPIQLVLRLAFEKCMSVAQNNPSDLVIGADTIVVLDNEILGKPKNEEEAFNTLSKLSNREHQVITGMSIVNLENEKKIVDYAISNVKFKKLTDQDIKDYISTKECLDKAGSYGIQGYGALLVEEIKGDYFNIVGLPISKLSDILKINFNINLFK
ncbi:MULTISPECIES: Maf family protein [Paraclostridium]|jgi:septum formation protein|uniref:dTTP/UTP pyrophosphatase n=2 Tax=Paraclostridium bifermentans TaxID=1490 RepID=A0AA44DL08_PARBF|nr:MULTISPECIES: Maf family protein [Paraclostridium]MCU9808215.1 Maf family protein [Paraclostridium sp. AKS46]MDU7904598.1 Maf family protein [Peptostreptococcaceae bacterium]MDV8110193.1 Maf family protein [Bacillus sp. BAU-SS-2023]EQK47800.1 septum formation protein Maf [[Clostridium] bifermentans ATCC 19299] [Paraclostridium bifermentans ATCC 19299]MBN8046245.1 septum formation inhibitor Maf [Paraclostridium bifermentans]